MATQQLDTYVIYSISILWCSYFLAIAADYSSYGTPHFSYNPSWSTNGKYPYSTYAPYPTKSNWYPVAGPYTYGPAQNHYTTPFPHHHFHDYPPGFSQQQIVHIHDVGPPDVPNGDIYQEGNDYNIHNIISHVDTLHQDLVEEASSKVETRKPVPNTATTSKGSNLNKRRTQNKSGTRKPYDNKRKQNLRRPRPVEGQFRKTMKPRQPTRSTQRQDPQFRRQETPRRKTRPTRKAHSRRPYYDDDYEYYGRRRGNEGYRGNGYRHSNRAGALRQDDDYYEYDDDNYYYDNDNYDETTESTENTEPTSTEEETLATIAATTATTTTTTEPHETITVPPTTEINTTARPEVSHGADLHGYGPSNGHENISITYAPIVHDYPISNLWYSQQGLPDIFQYRNYFSSRDILN